MVSARIAIRQSGASFGTADGAADVRSVGVGSCPAAIDREKHATGFANHCRRKSSLGLGRAPGLRLYSLIRMRTDFRVLDPTTTRANATAENCVVGPIGINGSHRVRRHRKKRAMRLPYN